MPKQFELVVGSPEVREGASLTVVLERLNGLHRIFRAVESAVLHPGSARGRLPSVIEDTAALRVLGASKKRSLAISIVTPPISYDSFGDFAPALRLVEPKFIDTLASAAERNLEQIVSLYPEKVDQVRVLRNVQQFSAGPGQTPTIIDNLVDSRELVFHNEIREWAEYSLPSTAPEPITIQGLVKSGRLGNSVSFQVDDGNRVISIDPDSGSLLSLKNLFGRIVNISGVAEYANTGVIKKMRDISSVEKYSYSSTAIRVGKRLISLRKPLSFEVTTDDRGTEFIAESIDMDIHAHGGSLSAAIDAANEEFIAIWDSIGNAP